MKKADPLFHLIKSLTKAEKIFFKKQAATSGHKVPAHVKLFDAMDKMADYDEEKLKQKFKNEPFVKRLAFEKNYLKSALLDALCAFGAARKQGDRLKQLTSDNRRDIDHVHILIQRNILGAAEKLLHKAKKEAKELELFIPLMDILNAEETLNYLQRSGNKNWLEKHRQIYEEKATVARRQLNFAEMAGLLYEMRSELPPYTNHNEKDARENIKRWLAHPMIKDPAGALSKNARWRQLELKVTAYGALPDMEKCWESLKEQVALIETYPRNFSFTSKVTAYGNFIGVSGSLGKREEGNHAVLKQNELDTSTPAEKDFLLQHQMASVIPFYFSTRQYELALEWEERVMGFLATKAEALERMGRLHVYTSFLGVYITLGEYQKAVDLFEMYLTEPWVKSTVAVQPEIHLMGIVAHFESGNSSIVESLCRNLQRTMQTQKGYHELEKVVINRIQKVPTEAGEKTYWQDFHAAISSAIEQERDSNKGRFQMLDMSAWCESKITGKSIRELIEKKAT